LYAVESVPTTGLCSFSSFAVSVTGLDFVNDLETDWISVSLVGDLNELSYYRIKIFFGLTVIV
jgi:hypothetical protein